MREHLDTLKIWVVNIGSLSLTATNVEAGLKIMVLAVSLGYTLHKWLIMSVKKRPEE
jgi:hypothetical protein